MCGIVGYVGRNEAVPILLEGLSHLEYRGYDSAGIACLNNGSGLLVIKEKGKLEALRGRMKTLHLESSIGVGHTRWATHGEPSQANAHPHTDCRDELALVHNGIIENYESLRRELSRKGHHFKSETDTEVFVHLIEECNEGDLAQALRKAIHKAHGYFAFVLISKKEPDRLYVFKRSNPLVIGLGQGENFVASDVPALLPYTRDVIYLEDDEYAIVQKREIQIFSLRNKKQSPLKRKVSKIEWSVEEAKKGGFPHFMLKEIYEQPRVLAETIAKRLDLRGNIKFDSLKPKDIKRLKKIEEVNFVGCGTAYHAGLVGDYLIEQYARLSAQSTFSSEFRYADNLLNKKNLVVFITQSGETADTLAALREAKNEGAFTLAIVNVVGSTISREADAVIYTHAGPEIGVASTKAYIAQLITLVFFALFLANLRRKKISRELKKKKSKKYEQWNSSLSNVRKQIYKLPLYVEQILKLEKSIEECARRYLEAKNFFFVGRGYNYPTALEGALKLNEITYAPSHGHAAGELKHGPIASIDSELPQICLAPHSKTYTKMISNIQEIRAREGRVIAIGTEKDSTLKELATDFFPIPACEEAISPILTVIPLQLFAYKMAVLKGKDVDQPRNLAKSVTVE